MPVKIIDPILARNFEVIRDRIALILADELANQSILQPSEDVLKATVWLERFIPIDKEEVPAIIVYTNNADYDDQNPKVQKGENVYFIDCYAKAKHTDAEKGDQLASKKLSRLIGVIQYILSTEEYAYLNFAPGLIQRRWVKSFIVDNGSGQGDGTHSIKGRVEFHVIANEEVIDPATKEVGDIYSEFLIDESDKGYEIKLVKT